MTLKILKPTTSGQRGTVLVDKSHLWKGNSLKSLIVKSISTGGRNNQGRITSRRMGGGAKKKYRIIDFKRASTNIPKLATLLDEGINVKDLILFEKIFIEKNSVQKISKRLL